jgi:hypothetical protein
MFEKDSSFVNSYFKVLVDRVYKILPLYEEGKNVEKYLDSLLDELKGVGKCVEGIIEESSFLSLYAHLTLIHGEIDSIEHEDLRRMVFQCIGLVKKLHK